MLGHYVGQCPNKKKLKPEKEEQVANTVDIESYDAKFEKSFVTVVSSCSSSRLVNAGRWIVESA